MTPADSLSSYRAIESLIATYAELVDDGHFGVADLLAEATFTGGIGSVSGREAIEKMLRDNVIVYDDGTPRTKHVTTNLAIEVKEDAGTAVSGRTSQHCKRCPTWRFSRSSAVAITTASHGATGSGALSRGAFGPIWSGT